MNAQNLNMNINGGCAALAIATENSISNLREGNYSAFFQEYLDSSLGDRGEKTKEIRNHLRHWEDSGNKEPYHNGDNGKRKENKNSL